MDIVHTIKSIFSTVKNIRTDYKKIYTIFEEPINIIDNLYYCSEFNYNNESVIRDYNFKNIIYVGTIDSLQIVLPNSKYYNINLDFDIVKQDKIFEYVELINRLQLIDNPDSNEKDNIMIYSDSIDKIYFILICLLICKYNFTIKKAIRFLEKTFKLKKNTIKLDDKTIEIISYFT